MYGSVDTTGGDTTGGTSITPVYALSPGRLVMGVGGVLSFPTLLLAPFSGGIPQGLTLS